MSNPYENITLADIAGHLDEMWARNKLILEWAHYYIASENFDRTLPGWWSSRGNGNTWIPFDAYRGRSSLYARKRMAEVSIEARADLKARNTALEFTDRHHTREANPGDLWALAERTFPTESP